MKIDYKTTTSLALENSDCLILPVFSNYVLQKMGQTLDKNSQGQIARLIQGDLELKLGSTLMIHDPRGVNVQRILCIYYGAQENIDTVHFQKIITTAAKATNKPGILTVSICLGDFPLIQHSIVDTIPQVISAFEGGFYVFEDFKTAALNTCALQSVELLFNTQIDKNQLDVAINTGKALAEGIHLTKQLSNLPANHGTPSHIAKIAQSLEKTYPTLSVEVLDMDDAVVQNMGGLLAVAQGSAQAAKFVIIRYRASKTKPDQSPVVLIGKGVTFDSGGISIKPAFRMEEMKFDMAGAASVLGVIKTAAQLELSVPLVGILPLTENLLGSKAMKPGDVIYTLSGKTVEIIDTDAEGRLILADALTYSQRFNPAVVIDIGTLTGAIGIALGSAASGLMTTDADLCRALEAAGKFSGDRVWSFPLWEDYYEMIQSNVADVANVGEGGAGSITAAAFLSRFVDTTKWAHLDIGETAYVTGKNKTATGRPVALLVQYLLHYCQSLN